MALKRKLSEPLELRAKHPDPLRGSLAESESDPLGSFARGEPTWYMEMDALLIDWMNTKFNIAEVAEATRSVVVLPEYEKIATILKENQHFIALKDEPIYAILIFGIFEFKYCFLKKAYERMENITDTEIAHIDEYFDSKAQGINIWPFYYVWTIWEKTKIMLLENTAAMKTDLNIITIYNKLVESVVNKIRVANELISMNSNQDCLVFVDLVLGMCRYYNWACNAKATVFTECYALMRRLDYCPKPENIELAAPFFRKYIPYAPAQYALALLYRGLDPNCYASCLHMAQLQGYAKAMYDFVFDPNIHKYFEIGDIFTVANQLFDQGNRSYNLALIMCKCIGEFTDPHYRSNKFISDENKPFYCSKCFIPKYIGRLTNLLSIIGHYYAFGIADIPRAIKFFETAYNDARPFFWSVDMRKHFKAAGPSMIIDPLWRREHLAEINSAMLAKNEPHEIELEKLDQIKIKFSYSYTLRLNTPYQNYEKAFALMVDVVDSTPNSEIYSRSLYDLARMYFDGTGTPCNWPKAIDLMRIAAYCNNPSSNAQYTLALIYSGILTFESNLISRYQIHNESQGPVTDEKRAEAIKLLKMADEQDFIQATHELGTIYQYGRRVAPIDHREAFHYYSKAAERGHAASIRALAFYYSTGLIVPKDDLRVFELHKKAALHGNHLSMVYYGECFMNGNHVEIDKKRAFHYFMLALRNSEISHMTSLCKKIKDQLDNFQFDQQEIELFRRNALTQQPLAALSCKTSTVICCPEALYAVGYCLYTGSGVVQDTKTGTFFMDLAELNGLSLQPLNKPKVKTV
jgi:TPR repeat protein